MKYQSDLQYISEEPESLTKSLIFAGSNEIRIMRILPT